MSYSRRQLYAMGEPIGDSATYRKADGGLIFGGGGNSSQPTSTSTSTTQLPEWARGYAKDTLAKASQLTDINTNPYQTYGGQRNAPLAPMQVTAMQDAANMQTNAALGTGMDMAKSAGMGALGTNYQAGQYDNQFQAPQNLGYTADTFQANQMGPVRDVSARGYRAPAMNAAQTGYNPQLQNYQMGPAERVRTQSFAQPGSADAYMSPYMQNVVETQKREATRQSGIQGTQQQAQAAQAGAFGGGRDAIMRAERERNLGTQMNDIQAQGSQAAYQQAQQQFNTEQQARLQAQQANQQAGLTTGSQNLAANLGVQQLGAGQIGLQTSLANLSNSQQQQVQNQAAQLQTQGMNSQQAMQAALANQQRDISVGGQNLGAAQQTNLANQSAQNQAAQYGAGQGLQAAGMGAQYGLAGQQLGEQSRQYGAGLGLQGLQTGLQAAGQMGQLGQTQFGQQTDINKMQAGYGGMQQNQLQQQLDTNYGDFQNQMNYPYKQLGFMSDMIRGSGAGTSSASTVYQAPGSTLGQLGGLGMTAYGLSRYMADGGQVHGYAGGGAIEAGQDVDSENNLAAIIHKLPDQLLQQAAQAAAQRGDQEELKVIQDEMAMRASLHRGLASVVPPSMADMADEGMAAGANGGIVAFDEGGTTSRFSEFFKDSPEAIARRKLFEELKRKNEAMMKAERDRPGLFERTTPEKISSTEAKAIQAAQEYLGASRSAPQAQTQSTTSDPTGTGSGRGKVNPEAPSKREAAPTGGGGGGSKSDRPSSAISDLHPAIAASVDKALADMAASSGVSAGSFKSNFKDFHDMISQDNQGMLQSLQDQIAKGDQQVSETKGNALGNILATYGAQWAAKAAMPGATFLGSAASAAPAANEAMLSQDKIVREMNDVQNKINMDFTKFKVSLKKDDQKTALQATQDMERNELLAAQLREQAAFHGGSIALDGKKLEMMAADAKATANYRLEELGIRKGQIGAQNRRMDVYEKEATTRGKLASVKEGQLRVNASKQFEDKFGGKLKQYEKTMKPLDAQRQYNLEKQAFIEDTVGPYLSGGSGSRSGGASSIPFADDLD